MTLEQHLAHLVRLIQPPFTNGWWAYAKARAEEIALLRSDCPYPFWTLEGEHWTTCFLLKGGKL
jgi:hypothetical protein